MSKVDFDRVDAVTSRLGALADAHGIDALSDADRVVLLASWAKALVDNGGFNYFYEGASNATEVADAFQSLGLNEIAEAFRQSASIFPGGIPHRDHLSRQQWIAREGGHAEALFETLSSVVWECNEDTLYRALQDFMESHGVT